MSLARAAPSFGPTARAWLPLGEVVRGVNSDTPPSSFWSAPAISAM